MSNSKEEIVERFSPILDENHAWRFTELLGKIEQAFPHYRSKVVQEELDKIRTDKNSISDVKYEATLSLIIDLSQQGWELFVKEKTLYLKKAAHETADKQSARAILSSERKAQFQDESVISFIERMEQERNYNGTRISVRCLIGDARLLIDKIEHDEDSIVVPYIQLVSHAKDEYTGYWLSDIWRYFRYTWSIPYKTMPGRNLFYLVRDAAQEYHPIIGIFALGNSVLNLTVRDDEIGWTVESVIKQLTRKERIDHITQRVSGTNGKTVGSAVHHFLETEEEYIERVSLYSEKMMGALQSSIRQAIIDLYVKDFGYHRGTKYPSEEKVAELRRLADELRVQAINNKKNGYVKSYEAEAKETLFKKKRATELARLLDAKIIFNKYNNSNAFHWMKSLIDTEEGRKAVNVALVANRKTKIGSNMMEIIVCGAIPPYNELLGGKLLLRPLKHEDVSQILCKPKQRV